MCVRELYIAPRNTNVKLRFGFGDSSLHSSVVVAINQALGVRPGDFGYLQDGHLQAVFFREKVCVLLVSYPQMSLVFINCINSVQ